MKPPGPHLYPRMTARELLVSVAGDTHVDHTVVRWASTKGKIMLTCSCTKIFETAATTEALAAVKNSPPAVS